MAKAPPPATARLGLFGNAQPYRARDRKGRFVKVSQTPDQRRIIKTTAAMRQQLGMEPLSVLNMKGSQDES